MPQIDRGIPFFYIHTGEDSTATATPTLSTRDRGRGWSTDMYFCPPEDKGVTIPRTKQGFPKGAKSIKPKSFIKGHNSDDLALLMNRFELISRIKHKNKEMCPSTSPILL